MIDFLPIVVAVGAMASVSLLVLALWGGARPERAQLEWRRGAAQQREAAAGAILRGPRLSRIRLLNKVLSGTRLAETMALDLERADIPLRVAEYILLRMVVAVLAAAVMSMVLNNALVAVAGAIVGYFLPAWYVGLAKGRRRNALNKQLPEMLTIVSGSLKSGYGLLQGFEFAAQQMSPPMATELRRTIRDASLGSSLDEALAGLLRRLPTYEMDLMVTAVTIQRSVGGNLAEILDNVARTIRERERVSGEIQTLTSQQRLTGIVLAILPVALAGFLFVLNPDYMMPLFSTAAGRLMLMVAAALELAGIFIIRRILAIDV